MKVIHSYHVYSRDIFTPKDFPEITCELKSLREIFQFPIALSELMSRLKGQMAGPEWVRINPLKQMMIREENFPFSHIQSLFQASRHNNTFSVGLEQYIRHELSK